MELELFEANNGECPYLVHRQWRSYTFKAGNLENRVYEALISQGFRRSGCFFYKNNCSDCNECVSIRLNVKDVVLSKSQKRTWNKNQDISVTWHPVKFDPESFELYRKYSVGKHGTVTSEKNYKDFLVFSAVDTIMMRYYLGQKLIGVGWVDVLENSLSSVYFAYDLDFHKRRLGIFSFFKELELARQLAKKFLHLGFWVKDCEAMSYKQQFRPHELLIDGIWVNHAEKMN